MPRASAAADGFVSGLILAAGASRRMGRAKQLLPLAEGSLLQHVVDQALASRLDELILVLGHRAEEVRRAIRLPGGRPLRVVTNADYASGLSSSLRLGLRAADARAVAAAVLLGDQPGVTAERIDRLVEAFLAADSPALRPVYRDASGRRVPGHPVLLARRIWSELERLRGDEGARALLAARPEWLLEIPLQGEPPADVDREEDYRRALGAHPSSRS